MRSYTVKIKSIELESDSYHILTRIKIGKSILQFIVDTGASHTCMDKEIFTSIQSEESILEYEGDRVGIGGTGFGVEMTVLHDFKIGRMYIPEYPIILLDMSHIRQTYERLRKPEIAGILGCDFLMRYDAVIDFKAKEIKLWKSN